MAEEMSLAVFDPIKALTVKMQEEDAALEIDHTTPEGEKQLRSYVRTVRGYRAGLEKIRVRAKANSLEYGQSVDKLAKELKAPFDTVIDDRMKPLDEIEDAKRKAAEAIVEAERIAAEKAEADRLAELKLREEKVARKEAEIKVAEDAANAEQAEADRVVREKRIADEAAEKARLEAEAQAMAVAKAKEDLRLAQERDVIRKKERAEEVERKRVTDKNHRYDIEDAAKNAIWGLLAENEGNSDMEICENILTAIKDNKIPHVTINY